MDIIEPIPIDWKELALVQLVIEECKNPDIEYEWNPIDFQLHDIEKSNSVCDYISYKSEVEDINIQGSYSM